MCIMGSVDDYNQIHILGSGACGSVYLVRHKNTNRLYALKKIQLDERRRNRTKTAVLKEAKILSELKHPNIVAYHDSFFDPSDEFLCIVQDYCDGGTLDDKIQETAKKNEHFSEKQVTRWFIQLTMAVQHMHSKRILHRDLKTQNVFMNKSGTTCKLGDFGISKMMEATIDLASTCVGTPCYLAPEMCQDIPYSSKADVWALGCLLHEMLTLRPTFEANNLISLFYKIIKAEVEPIPDTYSEGIANLVKTVLNKSPDERPTARQILTLPYVKENLAEFIVELMSANEHRESPVKSSARSRNVPQSSRTEPPQSSNALNRSQSVDVQSMRERKAQWSERHRLSQTMDSAIKLNIPHTEKTPRKVPVSCTPRKAGEIEQAKGDEIDGLALAPPTTEGEYEDDFEDNEESDGGESLDECPEDENIRVDKDVDEIEEELSQGSGEDTDDEYADDFEPYDSDDDLDGMMAHAQEMCDELSSDEEDDVVTDEQPSGFINSYKGLLQEHAIARLGRDKYKQLTEKSRHAAVTAEDIKMSVMRKSEDMEHMETCFLVELLNEHP